MPQRLTRDTKNAVLGGVAAGLGDYFGVDPVLVRLVFVLLAFVSGIGVIAYAVCWMIMPRQGEAGGAAGEPRAAGGAAPGERRSRVVAGVILIVLGAAFLLDRMWWWHWPAWLRPGNIWPVVLIVIGASIIWQALRGMRT